MNQKSHGFTLIELLVV
ncbi:MAG: type II secretion system protein [Victivallales bacterium]|nr:type II secretion system protein [Victivallales bacterium]